MTLQKPNLDFLTWEDFIKLKEAPEKLAYTTIGSGSMEPVLRRGDHIVVDLRQDTFKPFDIIVFWNNNILICHILIQTKTIIRGKERSRVYLTTPLVNGPPDEPITSDKILGLVVSHRLRFWHKVRLLVRFWNR